MTYVVAWKHRDSVFIIADSATTRTNAHSPRSPLSSFGEQHIANSKGVIEESAFKLFRRKNVALACAGDVPEILEFVRRLDDHLGRGMPAWAALVAARRETQVSQNKSFEAVAALRLFGGSRLARLSSGGEWVPSDDKVVHLGTPSTHVMSIVHTTIGDARRADKSPDVQMACVLASCQGLTVQQGLLEQHAGGAFSGIIFDGRGARWQPDVAYLVLDPAGFSHTPILPPANDVALYVSCLVRNDILVVNSQAKAGAVGFLSPLSDPDDPAVLELANEALQQANATREARAFDFVTILSTRWHVTTVIETKKQSSTAAIRLSYAKENEKRTLVVQLNSQLASKLRGNPSEPNIPRIFFYDYREYAPDETAA
ncbi:MAG: hypothetical protein K2P70_04215 [Hyphomonadaceae bacterium]|nr:hypothetical protein [Hyphomonadaceae bacterium]